MKKKLRYAVCTFNYRFLKLLLRFKKYFLFWCVYVKSSSINNNAHIDLELIINCSLYSIGIFIDVVIFLHAYNGACRGVAVPVWSVYAKWLRVATFTVHSIILTLYGEGFPVHFHHDILILNPIYISPDDDLGTSIFTCYHSFFNFEIWVLPEIPFYILCQEKILV